VGSLFLSSGAEGTEHPATAEGTTPVAQQNPARSPGTGPIGQRPKARGPELKAPMPRQQRRRLAFLAGSSMLFASAAIITWVGHGAWEIAQRDAAASVRLTPGVQAPASLQAVTPSATIPSQAPSQTPEPTPSADATPTPTLPQLAAAPARIPNTNVADFKNVVGNNAFFGTSKSQLTPDAKRVLRVYCQQIRDEKRYGMVTIKAWADERGGLQYNRNLSQSRADAVRLYMLSQLADLSINKKVTFKATGEGVSTLTATAGANDRFALNRRIKIIFPRPTGAKPSVTATK
jgi:outer membrane protein OmpA-like peptidoglycan-associated protein